MSMQDAASTLVAAIAGWFYPAGVDGPAATGDPVKVFAGWVDPEDMRRDLQSGVVNVTVWPTSTVRTASGIAGDWREVSRKAPTISAEVNGDEVTFSGAISTPQVVALVIDQVAYTREVQAGDTLESMAAALANLISADRTATADGPTLAVPGTHELLVRLVTRGEIARTVRREERTFQITTWTNSPAQRDRIARLLEPRLADAHQMSGLTLRWADSAWIDDGQKQGIYRHDIRVRVEYALARRDDATAIGIVEVDTSIGPNLAAQSPPRSHLY